jgi:hypothetical protein
MHGLMVLACVKLQVRARGIKKLFLSAGQQMSGIQRPHQNKLLGAKMKNKSSLFSAAVLAVLLAMPAVAATTTTTVKSDLSGHVKEAKQASFELRKNAERLHAITRSAGHSWQSHSAYLDAARER